MHVPAWAIRVAPYVGGTLLVGAAYLWAYDNGRDTEREKWVEKEAVATLKARERENAMQAQVDAAGLALSLSTAEIERLGNQARIETRTYYRENPGRNVACLTPDRMRSVSESDAAAYAAATSSQRAQ